MHQHRLLFLIFKSTLTFQPTGSGLRKYSLIYTMSFLFIQQIKQLIKAFPPFEILFYPFSFLVFQL